MVTPPLSAGCLPGITRELLITTVSAEGFRVLEKTLHLSDLEMADEVFITSSTRELMTVASVAGIKLKTGGAARSQLQLEFTKYTQMYVATTRKGGY